jgi:phosphoglycerol transferase MdoB-like AlkP superfamily enzyme
MRQMPASTNTHPQETVNPTYADLCRVPAKPLGILVAICTLVAASYSELILGYLNRFASVYSFSFFALLFALLLPGKLFLLSIPLAVAALRGLNHLNELKIAGVYLPITFFDVKTVLADPMVFVNAVGIRNDLYRIVSIAFVLFGFALVASAFYNLNGYSFPKYLQLSRSRAETRTRSSSFVWNAVTLLVLVIAAQTCLARYGRFVHANLNTKDTKLWRELWLPSTQVTLSRELGILEYVAFSFAADEGADISLDRGPVPARNEVRLAAARFVNSPGRTSRTLLPNIVFFHAESTFDPALVFRLSAPVELPLWSKQAETRALGPLHVNVIGGGSWVTEFEVITGVDSRFFGYQGYYTHFYIAPKIKNSFVKYLARKGYKTAAFYPIEGGFYNAASAFRSYGFQEFVDGRALRLPPDWESLIDRDIIKAVVERGAFKSSDPFFYFISTSENHSPHPCRSFASDRQFVTTFAAKVSFEKNCQLNEYVKRATSTSDAFELVLNQLKKIERVTGRPFVLLVYGDHQPWSFTDGVYSVAGGTAVGEGYNSFADVRTSADGYQTFFHLLASNQTVVRSSFTKPPPASLLPTLASAFVAASHDDLYLPVNFLAFASCGSDIRASGCTRYAEISWGSHLGDAVD